MPNVELLRKTLAHIEANPDQWFQQSWMEPIEGATENECGTAYCFGGWAAVLHGATLDDFMGNTYAVPPPGESIDVFDASDLFEDDYDSRVYIGAYARKTLGLTCAQGDRLFVEHNTLDDLRRIVAELCEEATQ